MNIPLPGQNDPAMTWIVLMLLAVLWWWMIRYFRTKKRR
jgi:Mg2+ and Co2+ transporter CorA